MINLRDGMKVLDVGCGVGRPARDIATFTGCHVLGLNNSSYQIEKGIGYVQKEGLFDKVSFVEGDFMVSWKSPIVSTFRAYPSVARPLIRLAIL